MLFSVGAATITARVPAHVRISMGEATRIRFRSDKLHIFDRATGLRMPGRPQA